jgi:hypothetical protein
MCVIEGRVARPVAARRASLIGEAARTTSSYGFWHRPARVRCERGPVYLSLSVSPMGVLRAGYRCQNGSVVGFRERWKAGVHASEEQSRQAEQAWREKALADARQL